MILHCFTTILIVTASASSKVRVIGGKDAQDHAYPHQVSLRIEGHHNCGGSVITNQWILTAAHCLINYFNRASEVTVVVGSNHLINGGVAYQTSRIFIHAGYNKSNHVHDIGLLKTKIVIEFTEAVCPIPLASFDVLELGQELPATFTGWGSKYLNGTKIDVLQEIQLRVIKLSTCRKTFPEIAPGSLCTLSNPGKGICYGDSGGALVTDGQQIGIAAWGSPCAQGYPDIHTHVYYYLDWIKSTIEFNGDK